MDTGTDTTTARRTGTIRLLTESLRLIHSIVLVLLTFL